MADLWRNFWIRDTGTGQQVAQLHDIYIMMMMMMMIMTCFPNTIINIINFCCVWPIHHCIFVYVLNTSGWQTLNEKLLKKTTNICGIKWTRNWRPFLNATRLLSSFACKFFPSFFLLATPLVMSCIHEGLTRRRYLHADQPCALAKLNGDSHLP